jgi:putative FmdB family regulatory protein
MYTNIEATLTEGRLFLRWSLPIYEYECSSCRSRFERKQRFDEEPITSCPQCSGKARRLIHSVPVVFKGSGFYCTDYGRGAACNSTGKCKEPECEAKTETKKTEVKKEEKAKETK